MLEWKHFYIRGTSDGDRLIFQRILATQERIGEDFSFWMWDKFTYENNSSDMKTKLKKDIQFALFWKSNGIQIKIFGVLGRPTAVFQLN